MLEKLSKLFENFFRTIGKGFYFFFNNKNKAIRLTSIIFFCGILLTILGLFIKVFIYSDEAIKTTTEGLNKTLKSVTETVQKTSDELRADLLFEREKIATHTPDPAKDWKENAVKKEVNGSVSQVVVATDEAKKKLQDIIKNGFSKQFNREVDDLTNDLLAYQFKEADKMFEGIINNVPSFVRRHLKDYSNEKLFVEAMERELITAKSLENFLLSAAKMIDKILIKAVDKELDNQLRSISYNNPNLTYNELKKRMPDARAICESIYSKIASKIPGKLKGQLANWANRVAREHPGEVTASGLIAVASGLGTGLSATAAGGALLIGGTLAAPVAIVGVGAAFVLGGVTTIMGGKYGYLKTAEIEEENYYNDFNQNMQGAVLETRDEFKEALEKSIRDIVAQYKEAKFFENANIEVVPDEPPIFQDLKR